MSPGKGSSVVPAEGCRCFTDFSEVDTGRQWAGLKNMGRIPRVNKSLVPLVQTDNMIR